MQKVDLYQQPIEAVGESNTPPLFVKIITHPRTMEFVGGVPATANKTVTYILYDVLPDELRMRVKNAIDALATQG